MKRFLELNYYQFPFNNLSDVLKKAKANVGYLFFISKKCQQTHAIFNGSGNELLTKDGVEFSLIPTKGLNRINQVKSIHKEVKKIKPDYILIHGLRYGLFSFLLKKIVSNSIIIVQAHGFANSPKGLKRTLFKWMDFFVDGYVFTGKNNAQDWIDNGVFKKEKLFEIMEGSTDFFLDDNAVKEKTSFLWVGRLDENKDPITILKAFEAYLSYHSDAKLSMVYHTENLIHKVKDLINNSTKLKESVILVGELDHDELQKLYRKSQFFILGSHYEGSGYALLEAMACGCIPIITKIPSFEFMTNMGNCALLFEPGNTKELLANLKLTNTLDVENYQEKVLEQFQYKLSFEAIATDTFNAFEVLATRKGDK